MAASSGSSGGGSVAAVPAFSCARCHKLISLHSSLESLNSTTYHQISGLVTPPPSTLPAAAKSDAAGAGMVDVVDDVAISRQVVIAPEHRHGSLEPPPDPDEAPVSRPRPSKTRDLGGDGYVLVDDHAARDDQTAVRRAALGAQLFNLVSSNALADHPLCGSCAEIIQAMAQKRRIELEKEQEDYTSFLKSLESTAPTGSEDELDEEIRQLVLLDHDLNEQLAQLRQQEEDLRKQAHATRTAFEALEAEETEYMTQLNAYYFEQEAFINERDRIIKQYEHAAGMLKRLRNTNVYNDVFHMSYDGPFGTINGLRLGRLPSIPVDWAEVNAALGHTVLLVQVLAQKIKLEFTGYKPKPFGSSSKIAVISEKNAKELELYGPVESFGRLFRQGRFDQALVGLLSCVSQLCAALRQGKQQEVQFPYEISSNCEYINGLSIRNYKDEVAWTNALKYMLINLKWCLMHVVRLAPS